MGIFVVVTSIDRQQLVALHAKYASALVLYARQWCSSPDDAAQEAMIKLAQQSPPPHDPVAWLFTTARRRAMNQARAEKRRSAHHRNLAACRDSWFIPDDCVAPDSVELQDALETLDAIDRQIVVARIWGELSFQQLADLVDRPLSFVHRRYQRAIESLARRLDPDAKVKSS
jgi:DNA-directed RNA polymerase specialized sigma24 family protein